MQNVPGTEEGAIIPAGAQREELPKKGQNEEGLDG